MKRLFAALAVLAGGLLTPAAARAEFIVGLTSIGNVNPITALVTFDSATPGVVGAPVAITGLQTGANETVVGIDFRPADGALVAITRQGSGPNVGRGRVYTLDPTTGVATLINPQLTNAVTGAEVLLSDILTLDYGVDFNPVPNALRVVNQADQNLRITNGGAGPTFVDTPLNPPNPRISGIAYDNNVAGATTTTLYGIDTSFFAPDPARLRTIGGVGGTPSPNGGQVFDVAPLSGGPFANNVIGFDISGATGVAYASLVPAPGGSPPTVALYTVNLATGGTTLLGNYGGAGILYDIAVAPAAVPEPASLALLGVGAVGLVGYARRRGGAVKASGGAAGN